jgi:NAD(P)-dependent dehydrogenase (short-subunit alcohol dehydrogenase family)
MKLKDRVAIVAGGAQGIGEGIVHCLAEEGADISVIDVNSDAADRVAESVKALGRRALALKADLTDEHQISIAVRETADYFGRIDILVNNIGGTSQEMERLTADYAASLQDAVGLPKHLGFSPDIWDRYYKLNLKSHVMLSNAVTPHFVRQKSGKIVNISSVSGRFGEASLMPYATMKAADISLTWSLAQGLAPYNINVNCICPGFVYTPMWERGAAGYLQETRDAVREFKEKKQKLPRSLVRFTDVDLENMTVREYWLRFWALPNSLLKREQTPEDVGRAVVYFVSDDSKNVTGQVLHVDGGQVMR